MPLAAPAHALTALAEHYDLLLMSTLSTVRLLPGKRVILLTPMPYRLPRHPSRARPSTGCSQRSAFPFVSFPRSRSTSTQAIEVRVGPQGVKAKWVCIELRKVETLPGGGIANTFFDFVGQSPIHLWQSPNDEYSTLHAVSAAHHFFALIPFLIQPYPRTISPSSSGSRSPFRQLLLSRKEVSLYLPYCGSTPCPYLLSATLFVTLSSISHIAVRGGPSGTPAASSRTRPRKVHASASQTVSHY